MNFEIHYMNNIHMFAYYIYNFTHTLHPYVIVEYL
jgi:hypothetical protein